MSYSVTQDKTNIYRAHRYHVLRLRVTRRHITHMVPLFAHIERKEMIKKIFDKRKGYTETINLDVSMLEKINIDREVRKEVPHQTKGIDARDTRMRIYMRTASNFQSKRLRVDTETDCTP